MSTSDFHWETTFLAGRGGGTGCPGSHPQSQHQGCSRLQPRAGDPARPRGTAQHPMLPHVRPYCSAVKQGPELHCTASHQTAPCHHSLLQAASHHTALCHAASACSPPASTTAQQPAPPHTNLHLNLTKLHCTAPDATALPQRAANCTAPNFAGLHQTSPDRTKLHPSALKQPALHQLSPHSSLCECTGVLFVHKAARSPKATWL